MPHVKFLALLLLFSIGTARSPASAQTIPSPYTYVENSKELAVFVGKSDLQAGKLDLGPRDSDTFGARFSAAFGGTMAIDVSGTLFKSTRLIQDIRRPIDDLTIGRGDIDVVLFDARLRLNLTGGRMWHGFQPFLAFGGGFAFPFTVDHEVEQVAFMPSQDRYIFGTRFTGTVSGGTTFHVTGKISLRLEGMLNLWQVKTPIGWLTLDNNPLGIHPESEWVTAKSIMLGASWRW